MPLKLPFCRITRNLHVYHNNSNNQITRAQYDAVGNQTYANSNVLSCDAENRQASLTDSGVTLMTYFYDGNGNRVQTIGPGGTTTFAYKAMGELAAEYSTAESAPPA